MITFLEYMKSTYTASTGKVEKHLDRLGPHFHLDGEKSRISLNPEKIRFDADVEKTLSQHETHPYLRRRRKPK